MFRRRNRVGISSIALGLLVTGLGACGADQDRQAQKDGFEELGVTGDELGVANASCSTAGSTGFVAAGQVLTITMVAATPIILSAPAGVVTVNGFACVNAAGASLTTTGASAVAVKKIVINGTAGADKVIFDTLPGTFGAVLMAGTSGNGFVLDLAAGADTFSFRGTNAVDTIKMGSSPAGEAFLDLNNDAKADVGILNTETFNATLLAGNDVFTAAGGAITAASLAAGVTTLLPMSVPITVYGGDGNDALCGGAGNDFLYGGNGNDTFTTAVGATADGADTYIGGPGTDTMDYSGRTADLTVTIGVAGPSVTGNVDLSSAAVITALAGKTVIFKVDTIAYTATLSAPADAAAVVAQINTAAGSTVASVDPTTHFITMMSPTGLSTSTFQLTGGTGLATLGLASGAVIAAVASANDGQTGENDDVGYTVENIIGGTGNDTLTGSDQVNVISGGAGNDVITGVSNATCPVAGGDVLNGDAGNDTLAMGVAANCGVIVNGGAGTDIADFGVRTAALTITLDALANDGDAAAFSGAGEKAKVSSTDIEIVLGGTGNDTITAGANDAQLHGGAGNDTLNGGVGNDTFVGGPGNDIMNGGAGNDIFLESGTDAYYVAATLAGTGNDLMNGGAGSDKVDYSARAAALVVTLCVDSALTGAPVGTGPECTDHDGDGALTEIDNVVNVEWLVGGAAGNTITGSTADETIEGGAGVDTIHGGAGSDILYGAAGADALFGDAGDDYLEGGAGVDTMDGGSEDGDVCVADATDVVAPVNCEL